jgi:hypothetical protein
MSSVLFYFGIFTAGGILFGLLVYSLAGLFTRG